MKQAANALKWAVDEMERRYQLFADAGTKNIATYNGWVERVQHGRDQGAARQARSIVGRSRRRSPVTVAAADDGRRRGSCPSARRTS